MKKFFLITLIFTLAACATVPYTKRRQFNLIGPGQEVALGEQAYQEVTSKIPPSTNEEWQRRVSEIGRRIADAANEPNYKWEFTVLKSKEINAFCLPGGKVAFYEGIMPICGDNNGIAVVMGHEIAHALAHHGAERVSQGLGANLVAEILAVGLSNSSPENQRAVMQMYGLGAQFGVLLPFSRKQELEADQIGLILMAKAGYDPREAVPFWRRMSQQAKGEKPPEFLSTHPSDERRIRDIQKLLPEIVEKHKK